MKKSNCMIEAVKQKILNPRCKVFVGIHKKGIKYVHCWWQLNNETYHYTHTQEFKNYFDRLLFMGKVSKVNSKISKFYYHFRF